MGILGLVSFGNFKRNEIIRDGSYKTMTSGQIYRATGVKHSVIKSFIAAIEGDMEKAERLYEINKRYEWKRKKERVKGQARENENETVEEIVAFTGISRTKALRMLNDFTRSEILAGKMEDGEWKPQELYGKFLRTELEE